jgi:hypothetical protein
MRCPLCPLPLSLSDPDHRPDSFCSLSPVSSFVCRLRSIYKGVDFSGDVCGEKNDGGRDLTGYPFAVFPQPFSPEVIVCAKGCNVTADPNNYQSDMLTPYKTTPIDYPVHETDPLQYIIPYKSSAFLNWCYPDPTAYANFSDLFNSAMENSAFASVSATTSRAMNDLFTAYVVILISAFVALIFGFLYLKFLQYCAGVLVLFFILILVVGGFLMAFGFLQYAKTVRNSNSNTVGSSRSPPSLTCSSVVVLCADSSSALVCSPCL